MPLRTEILEFNLWGNFYIFQLSFSRDIFEIGEEAAIKLRIDETLLPSW
jgi:hypothetical protein